MDSIIIKGGLVHDAVHEKPYIADIAVEDGKIVKIAPKIRAYKKDTVIDASGLNVFPGVVEAHCHVGLRGYAATLEGDDVNEPSNPITPELRAIDGYNCMDKGVSRALQAGVTTICTGPGSSNIVCGTFIAVKTAKAACVEDVLVSPAAAMKCAFGENPKSCYRGKGDSNRMTTAAKLRELLFQTKEYAAKIDAAKGDPAKYPKFDMKLEAMLPVIRGEMPLKAHAHRADDICTAIRIAKEFGVKMTLEHCTEGHLIVDQLVNAGYPIAVGPTFSTPGKPELVNKSVETPAILSNAGLEISIVTDAPVTPIDYLPVFAGLAVKAGMDPFKALKAVTINAAKHVGIADRVGSIEVGKDADIVIANGSILESQTKIVHVLVDGKIEL